MTTHAAATAGPFQYAKAVLVVCAAAGALAGGIFGIVNTSENWQNGIYAGQHYKNALNTALTALAAHCGVSCVKAAKPGNPNVHNSRLFGAFGGPQIRVFRFIVQGKLLCVTTWSGGRRTDVSSYCPATR